MWYINHYVGVHVAVRPTAEMRCKMRGQVNKMWTVLNVSVCVVVSTFAAEARLK